MKAACIYNILLLIVTFYILLKIKNWVPSQFFNVLKVTAGTVGKECFLNIKSLWLTNDYL